MPTPIGSLQKTGKTSASTAVHYPPTGEIWNFTHHPQPISKSGRGGNQYDPVAKSRVLAADAQTRALVKKVQQKEDHTDRELKNELNPVIPPDKTRQSRAQASYYNRHASIQADSAVDGSNKISGYTLVVALALAYFVFFR